MAQPDKYVISYDFISWQAANPTKPLPADKVNVELNNVKETTDQIIDNLGLIQADDGGLANGIVTTASLGPELTIGLASPSAWVNGEAYEENDTVIEDNALYRCAVAHTSGVFATDLAAAKWVLVADYDTFLVDAGTAKDAAEAAQTAAEAAQSAAESAYDSFDDRYLGVKTSDPSLDNDGNALLTGALYWNSSTSTMKVYGGTTWSDVTAATNLPIFVYTATGGETSVSGADDNTNVLAYTPGKIIVFINGSNETQNVTATDGTSITGISPALSVSDVVEIVAFESVTVLEDVVSHSTATPASGDFLVFADITDSNNDRKATITDVVLTDGIIAQATDAVVTVSDRFLFSDASDSDNTKSDTIQGLIDLIPDQQFESTDITDQPTATMTTSDKLVFADASDNDILKQSTVNDIISIAQNIGLLTSATPASSDLLIFGDVSDSNNPKQATVSDIINSVGISQAGLNTSTGAFTATSVSVTSEDAAQPIRMPTAEVTMPGGTYGFAPQTRNTMSTAGGGYSALLFSNSNTSYTSEIVCGQFIAGQNANGATVQGQQRYITSSPPFDIGDGEVGGFIYLHFDDDGSILSHYSADVPPWAYNGPTSVRADYIGKDGKKYKKVREKLSKEQILDGVKPKLILQEITNEVKNADMNLIPSPIKNFKRGYVVLLDPMDDRIRNMIDYQNADGVDDVIDMLFSKHLKIDNEILNRKGPKGVGQVRFKL